MSTIPRQPRVREVYYPTEDGKPMAETPLHMEGMIDTIQSLQDHFIDRPDIYVWGNMMMYYEEGNPRKHLSPDIFLARVPRDIRRDLYLVWKEGKAPDFVTEITSKTTKKEDLNTKFVLYRDVLKVSEYVLFDPTADYLNPRLQGYRLVDGDYVAIEPVDGRLPSLVLGLHLEADGPRLRLFDPATGRYLPTRQEAREAEHQRAEAEHQRAQAEHQRAEAEHQRAQAAEAARIALAEENERLRREIEALRGGASTSGDGAPPRNR